MNFYEQICCKPPAHAPAERRAAQRALPPPLTRTFAPFFAQDIIMAARGVVFRTPTYNLLVFGIRYPLRNTGYRHFYPVKRTL